MIAWDIESFTTFPDSSTWLSQPEVRNRVGKFIVVTCETGVDFPVPDILKLGVPEGELLYGEPL